MQHQYLPITACLHTERILIKAHKIIKQLNMTTCYPNVKFKNYLCQTLGPSSNFWTLDGIMIITCQLLVLQFI